MNVRSVNRRAGSRGGRARERKASATARDGGRSGADDSGLVGSGVGVTKAGRGSLNSSGRGSLNSSGRGRPLTDDKRRRILEAALKVFAARGYYGTTVPEVADAAGVGVGTLYRYFADKNALVNELYRDVKLRLKSALLDGLAAPDIYRLEDSQRWFFELWRRLATFARAEPDAFRFLEMQDHVEYLDAESRALELSVLAPLWFAGKRLRDRTASGPPVDIAIAMLWGAFVGLVKAGRLGYLPLDDKKLEQAGATAWRLIAPEFSRATDSTSGTNLHRATSGTGLHRATSTSSRKQRTKG